MPSLEACDLLLTDPHYGGGLAVDFAERFKTKAGKWWNCDNRRGQARHTPIVGDDGPFDPIDLLTVTAKVKVFWGANWYASRLPDRGGWWVWDKRNGKRDVSAADWPMSEAELRDCSKAVESRSSFWHLMLVLQAPVGGLPGDAKPFRKFIRFTAMAFPAVSSSPGTVLLVLAAREFTAFLATDLFVTYTSTHGTRGYQIRHDRKTDKHKPRQRHEH